MTSRRRFILTLTAALLFISASILATRPFVQQRADAVWQTVSFPFRLAALAAQEPDAVLLQPVDGIRVSQIADTWGAPRSGGRSHQGQDIFAERGTPVFAVSPGFVTSLHGSSRGGIVVWVTGAGGRRYYYAHLEEHAAGLSVGDKVEVDTVLGYVGTSGNAAGTPPHLHFGVYTAQGAIDPLPLFAERD